MAIVASNAKRIIREKCLKQSMIAKKAGFEAKNFSAIMTGRKLMRDDYILPIAEALGVQPNELFKKSQTNQT